MIDAGVILPEELLGSLKYWALSCGFVLFVVLIVVLAWLSTGLRPLNYFVWLVQLNTDTQSHRRIIQVFTMNHSTPTELDGTLGSTGNTGAASRRNQSEEQQGTDGAGNGETDDQTTVIIIQTPSAVTNRTPSSQDAHAQENPRHFSFELPLSNRGEDIGGIHRFLRANADPEIATAATIALYNRRLTESGSLPGTPVTNNQLLVSRVSLSIESEEPGPPPQNIVISYDNITGEMRAADTTVTEETETESGSTTSSFSSDSDSEVVVEGEESSIEPSTSAADNTSHTEQGENAEECKLIPSAEVTEAESVIKLKFLDDTQKNVKTGLSSSVGDFKKKHFASEFNSGMVVRLIYQGQLLRDDSRSLESYGLHDHCVVHCHVGSRPYQSTNTESTTPSQHPSSESGEQQRRLNVGARIISTGISWLDVIILTAWSLCSAVWNWAHAEEVQQPYGDSRSRRVMNGVRRALRTFLDCLFDLQAQEMHDEAFTNRFNAGMLLGFLFALKFSALWTFVIYFPQFTDPKGVFILSVLTLTAALFFFFNRTLPTRNRR